MTQYLSALRYCDAVIATWPISSSADPKGWCNAFRLLGYTYNTGTVGVQWVTRDCYFAGWWFMALKTWCKMHKPLFNAESLYKVNDSDTQVTSHQWLILAVEVLQWSCFVSLMHERSQFSVSIHINNSVLISKVLTYCKTNKNMHIMVLLLMMKNIYCYTSENNVKLK